MNTQEAFTTAARHLLTQKERSLLSGAWIYVRCAYRGDSGKKCAIGCLIPDTLYDFNMEGTAIGDLLLDRNAVSELLDHVDRSLLVKLQRLHDDPTKTPNWKTELVNLAKEFDLKWELESE